MKVGIISSPKDKKLKNFYKIYSSIFTLPEDKTTFKGFQQVLILNGNKKLRKKYGFFKEQIIYLEEDKKIIAAINFAVYSISENLKKRFHVNATCHINYIFVDKKYRKKGLGKKLLNLVEKEAKKLIKNNKIYYFIEINNPSKMCKKEIVLDEKNSGINGNKRIHWWREQGFKRLVFNYLPPPLNKHKKPNTELNLNIKTNTHKISSEVISEHLYKFFNLSIFEGNYVDDKNYFLKQKEELTNQFIRAI